MSHFELTAPMQSEVPGGTRVTNWREMEGKTLRAVIESPRGRNARDVAVVLVFEDDCWATLVATRNSVYDDDGASLELDYGSYGRNRPLTDYLNPHELLQARMVNQGQYEYLVKQLKIAGKTEKAERRARLLAEAEKLAKELSEAK